MQLSRCFLGHGKMEGVRQNSRDTHTVGNAGLKREWDLPGGPGCTTTCTEARFSQSPSGKSHWKTNKIQKRTVSAGQSTVHRLLTVATTMRSLPHLPCQATLPPTFTERRLTFQICPQWPNLWCGDSRTRTGRMNSDSFWAWGPEECKRPWRQD